MAYNQGLTQQDKDRINQGVKDLAAQGKSKAEIMAWRDGQVEAAKAAVEAGKADPAAGVDAPAVSGGSASVDGISDSPPTLSEFAQTAGVKKPRVDDDGEVINLAQDFGQLGEIVESIPFIGDFVDDMYGAVKSGYAQGQTVDDALKLFADGADADPETIQKYMDAVAKQHNQPVSKEMQDFNETYEAAGGGVWGFVKAIAQNPTVAAQTAVSSMIAMINPASAAGAAIGGAGGAGAGAAFGGVGAIPGAIGGAFAGAGGILETGSSFTEFLQEEIAKKGLEFNEEGIAATLQDPEALFRIRGKSAARGGVIAVIDGLTAGVASRAAKGVADTALVASKLKGTLAATAIEGVGGGVGEAAARLAVGQELDAREIGLEIVGEFGTGVAIGQAAIETQPAYEINGQKVNRATAEAVVNEDPSMASTVKVKNDPDMQSAINKKIADLESVENNTDIITSEERELRDNGIKDLANLYRQRDQFEKGTPERASIENLIDLEKREFKQKVKDQNSKYAGITEDERSVLINNQSQIDNNNKAIEKLQKQEGNDKIITKLQEQNEELSTEANQVRAEVNQRAEQKRQQREARKAEQEAAAQEEVAPEQEVEPVDTAAYEATKEQIDEVINEDVQDNTKAVESIEDQFAEIGVLIDPKEGIVSQSKAESYIPLTKEGESFVLGDFEKEVRSYRPMDEFDAKNTAKIIKREAKKIGATSNVQAVQNEDGTWGVFGDLIAGERDQNLADQVSQQNEQQALEQFPAPDAETIDAGIQEAAYKKGYEGEVIQDEEGVFYPGAYKDRAGAEALGVNYEGSGPGAIHSTVNRFKRAGYPDAKAVQTAEGVNIVKGKYVPSADNAEFSIAEEGPRQYDIDDRETALEDYEDSRLDATVAWLRENGQEDVASQLEEGDISVADLDDSVIPQDIQDSIESQAWENTLGAYEAQHEDGDAEFSIDEAGRAHAKDGKFAPKSQGTEVARVKALPLEAEDGATFNLDGTVYEEGGLVVPIASKNMKASELTNEAIENFKTKYKDYMGPASKVGIYKFPGQDQVSIDLNVIAPSSMREEALKIGSSLGQESLFDLDTFENIKTGQTGANPKTPTAAQAKNISNQLSDLEFSFDESPANLTQLLTPEQKRAQRLEIQKEAKAPKRASTPIEKFEDIARIKPKTIRTEGRRGPVPTYEGGVIQEGTPAPRGEEFVRDAEGRFTKESPFKAKGYDALKGKITDDVIDKFNEGKPNEALVASIPYVRALAKGNQRNRDAGLDPEIESVAIAAASEAFINGEYQGRQFAPENAGDAIKLLGGIVKDAVRDYYLGPEGAAAGIPQIKKDASTRLNKINAAVSRLGTKDPVAIAEALNEGFTSIQEKKLPGEIQKGFGRIGETARYLSPEQLGKDLPASRAKSRVIKDENITPQQVNDLLAKQKGLTPHRIDVTPFDKIADDVSEGLEAGTGSIADILGVNLDALPKSNRDIAAKLNPKEVRSKLDDIINAVSKDPDTRKNIKRYVDREVLSQAQKARALKEFAAKLLNAERDIAGKQTTPSQELEFSIEAGTATRHTDLGDRSGKQVNSHRQPWYQTAKELNDVIGKTDFNKDWVQWSPGQLGNIERAKAKRMPDHVIRELNKQPARVAKLAGKHGLNLRRDTRNPGVYHVYKPGKPGSKPELSVREDRVNRTRPTQEYRNAVVSALKKGWGSDRVYDKPSQWNAKVYGLQLSGSKMPFDRVKGLMHAGAVYLNPAQITMDTPIHEFAHIWAKKLMRENPELWKRGMQLLKGSDYARAVYEVPTYKQYLKDSPSRFWEEVMANAIGKKGAYLFDSQQKAGRWDRWMDKVGKWLKQKLNISSNKNYNDLTLDDWLDIGVHGTFTGQVFKPDASAKPEFSMQEDSWTDEDVLLAKEAGKRADWRKIMGVKVPRNFADWLVPPAADDFHGLISKINTKGKNEVRDAFINAHHKYVERATDLRDKVRSIRKALGNDILNNKAVTHRGVELTGAQAIQAHMDGYSSPALDKFISKPNVQKYINDMGALDVLGPSRGTRTYLEASPDYDVVNYIINDLYKGTFADFNKKREEVFSPQELGKLRAEKGNRYVDALENSLRRMASGKTATGVQDATTRRWNDWAQGSVGTIMFLNFRSAALQMLSVGNYGFSSEVNSAKFIGNLAKGFARLPFDLANKNSALRKRLDHKFLRERRARAGFDVNMQELADSIEGSDNFGDITKKILNYGFKATAAVDSLAIALGGEAFVQSGGSERAWIEQTEEAQQSSRPDRVSQWQTTGISKFVLAFANTPAQYFRLGQKAYRTIRDPKASSKDKRLAASKVLWYMAAQNALFVALQAASKGVFDEDEEEVKSAYNSMADSILRGMGMYGAIISSLKNVAYEADKQSKKSNPDYITAMLKATSISPPLNKKINDLIAIGRGYQYKNPDADVTAVAKGIAVTTNLPADWAQKKFNAAVELWEDNYGPWQKFLMLLGYSPYALDKKNQDDFEGVDFGGVDFGGVDFEEVEF